MLKSSTSKLQARSTDLNWKTKIFKTFYIESSNLFNPFYLQVKNSSANMVMVGQLMGCDAQKVILMSAFLSVFLVLILLAGWLVSLAEAVS